MTYDSHKRYRRVGECKRCGRCCDLHCKDLVWVANRDVKKGERFTDTGIDQPFMAVCTATPKPEQCVNFPTNPFQTPLKCGYSWVEEG